MCAIWVSFVPSNILLKELQADIPEVSSSKHYLFIRTSHFYKSNMGPVANTKSLHIRLPFLEITQLFLNVCF